jgi:hypothetical protein
MKDLLHYRWLCLLITVVLASFATAQDTPLTLDLQPKFIAGQQSRYSLWTKRSTRSQVTVAGNTREQSTSYIVDGQGTWSVISVNGDGSAQCQMTFDWLSFTLTMPDGSTQVNDTRNGTSQTPPVYAVIMAMVGHPVDVAMAADGSAISVSGTDAMRSAAGADVELPEDLDFVESASDLATLPFAPAAATVGQSWDASFRWSHELGFMNHSVRYSLDSVRNIHGINLATITGQGTMTLDIDPAKLPKDDSVQVDVSLVNGSFRQQVLMDMDRREAVGRNSVMTTQIRTTMNAGENNITQLTSETVQSQALRISETDPVP